MEEYNVLKNELLAYFNKERFRIFGVKESNEYPAPSFLDNDGYGDQQDKQPDILAFDDVNECFVVGLIKLTKKSLEAEDSQTEYNVFLDQKEIQNGQPYRLYIIVPSILSHEITGFMTHYIHREYWYRITIVVSKIL
jgi:hypothetical protein